MAVDKKYSIVFLKDKVTQHNYVFYYLTKLLVRFLQNDTNRLGKAIYVSQQEGF